MPDLPSYRLDMLSPDTGQVAGQVTGQVGNGHQTQTAAQIICHIVSHNCVCRLERYTLQSANDLFIGLIENLQ